MPKKPFREYWDAYPQSVYEQRPLFGDELERLEGLEARAKSLGLSQDDIETLQEAAIAMKVLEDRAKEGFFNWQTIERVRRVAEREDKAKANPKIREILEIRKVSDAKRQMILRWWQALSEAAVTPKYIHDRLHRYPEQYDSDVPYCIRVPTGHSARQRFEWLAGVVAMKPNNLRTYLETAALEGVKRGDDEFANLTIPTGWS